MGEGWIGEGRRQKRIGEGGDYRREKRMGEGWIIEGRREWEKVGLQKVDEDGRRLD